ncbi:heavy metal-associated isoprenylated plant protein 7-like isoform X1 [Amaranthus tricolor]|uniref:heavy metal-associated isoprenylated plant protein 7-like isoform X1 n=1 Tax=Amaranthus tricolor TaxID=29722 RepID=UPI0025833D15|nr:heavy metal-associated isoprenylated plant protein 7-like isoform X1 [Amaranthus tricolor]
MGEQEIKEKKEKESSGGEESAAKKNVEEKKEKESVKEEKSENEMIIIKVDMHCQCEACAKKIVRAVRTFQGVEDVAVDRKTNMVAIKGKTADPIKLCDRIQHKTGRKAILVSPIPKPPEEQPKPDENKDKIQEPPKEQPPPIVTVMLGVHMHCEACAQQLQKRIRKIKGIESVETNVGKSQVIVKGVITDPEALLKYVHKKTKKQVSIIINDEQKIQESNKNDQAEKKEQKKEKSEDNNEAGMKNVIDHEARLMMMGDMNRHDYYWPSARYDYMEYHHHNNLNYQPQIFSDENPNACSIM